jgi:hypothetical protein
MKCLHCGEEIAIGDQIISTNNGKDAMHKNCGLRGVIGSVAHLERRCSCFIPGAMEGDPPGMTRREAADAAVRVWLQQQKEESTMSEVPAEKPRTAAKLLIVSWIRNHPHLFFANEFASCLLLLTGGAVIAAECFFRWFWHAAGLGVCMLVLCVVRAWRNYNLQNLFLMQKEVVEKQKETIHQLEVEVIKHQDVIYSALVLKKNIEVKNGVVDMTSLMQSVDALFSQEKSDLSKLN